MTQYGDRVRRRAFRCVESKNFTASCPNSPEIAALDYVFPAPHRRCVIAGEGGTIGRDVRNTLVLDDRFCRVSRIHAEVTLSAACQSSATARPASQ